MTRELPPTSAFAGDDGSADPALAAALAALLDTAGSPRPDGLAPVVRALGRARVLVPVMSQVDVAATGASGLAVDKEASTGVVALRTPDGRTGLPVFTSTATVAAWRGDVRPVPAEGPRAAASALAEGWDVLVVDPGGPVTAVVPRPALRALALGEAWRPAVVAGAVRPEVVAAVARALAGIPQVVRTDAVPGRRAEVAVVLALGPGLDRAGLDAVLARAGAALAADDLITTEVDTLELRVVAAD